MMLDQNLLQYSIQVFRSVSPISIGLLISPVFIYVDKFIINSSVRIPPSKFQYSYLATVSTIVAWGMAIYNYIYVLVILSISYSYTCNSYWSFCVGWWVDMSIRQYCNCISKDQAYFAVISHQLAGYTCSGTELIGVWPATWWHWRGWGMLYT